MQFNKIFYTIKPLIPRLLQIFLRRRMVTYKRKKYAHIWPIDPDTATAPEGWRGWPDNKKFAVVLSHDVDTQEGHDRCYPLMEIEENLGFRSSFNFVAEKYYVSQELIKDLKNRGFEVCNHGLNHDGKLFFSREVFEERAKRINHYLQKWDAKGFTSPSMHHNLDWMHALNIMHSTSTFDTDPFEPQPDAVGTIFPLWVQNNSHAMQSFEPVGTKRRSRSSGTQRLVRPRRIDENRTFSEGLKGYVELPYTLPQDFTLFILMNEKNIDIWKKKLDWIAEKGGMVLFNSHPDYINFNKSKNGNEEYSADLYIEFLEYIKKRYKDQYWHALPREVAHFWQQNYSL